MALNSLVRDPDILGGVPVFPHTRVPFQALLDYLEGGQTLDEFLNDFPATVQRKAAIAALEQARTMNGFAIRPKVAVPVDNLPEEREGRWVSTIRTTRAVPRWPFSAHKKRLRVGYFICRPEPPCRNIQQHFVPASYLAGFTPDANRDSQLYVYERNHEAMFRSIPDEAAKSRNYYSIPLKDGGFDDAADEMLTALEKLMPVLRKLLARDYELTPFERGLRPACFIAFQEFRTPAARANFQKVEVKLTERMMEVAAAMPGYLERVIEKQRAEGESEGDVTAQQLREALQNEKIKVVANRHAGIDTMVSVGQSIGDIYARMPWAVFHSEGVVNF